MEKETVNSLGYLLDRALWVTSNALNKALKDNGIDLPHSQYIIMRVLFEKDGVSQNEIAVFLHKDAAAIKRSIDYLEKKDLVIRKSESPCKYGIYLTDKGQSLKPEIIAIANDVFHQLLSGVPGEIHQNGIAFLKSLCKSSL